MTPRLDHPDLRRIALVWCFHHLDEGLDAQRLAALWLEERMARGAERGAVPEALLLALDEDTAARALEGLVADRLLEARRFGGFQVTDGGLVLARAAAQAAAAARGELLLDATAKVPAELVDTPEKREAIQQLVADELARELPAAMEAAQRDLERRILEGGGLGVPRGLLEAAGPPSTYAQEKAHQDHLERRRRRRAP